MIDPQWCASEGMVSGGRQHPSPTEFPIGGRHLALVETYSSLPKGCSYATGRRVQREEENIGNNTSTSPRPVMPLGTDSPWGEACARGQAAADLTWADDCGRRRLARWKIWIGEQRRWSSGGPIGLELKKGKVEGEQAVVLVPGRGGEGRSQGRCTNVDRSRCVR